VGRPAGNTVRKRQVCLMINVTSWLGAQGGGGGKGGGPWGFSVRGPRKMQKEGDRRSLLLREFQKVGNKSRGSNTGTRIDAHSSPWKCGGDSTSQKKPVGEETGTNLPLGPRLYLEKKKNTSGGTLREKLKWKSKRDQPARQSRV